MIINTYSTEQEAYEHYLGLTMDRSLTLGVCTWVPEIMDNGKVSGQYLVIYEQI